MTKLKHEDGFRGQGDATYEALVEAHRGLDDAASGALNTRLVLLLANHIGDLGILKEAIIAARASLAAFGSSDPDGSPK